MCASVSEPPFFGFRRDPRKIQEKSNNDKRCYTVHPQNSQRTYSQLALMVKNQAFSIVSGFHHPVQKKYACVCLLILVPSPSHPTAT